MINGLLLTQLDLPSIVSREFSVLARNPDTRDDLLQEAFVFCIEHEGCSEDTLCGALRNYFSVQYGGNTIQLTDKLNEDSRSQSNQFDLLRSAADEDSILTRPSLSEELEDEFGSNAKRRWLDICGQIRTLSRYLLLFSRTANA